MIIVGTGGIVELHIFGSVTIEIIGADRFPFMIMARIPLVLGLGGFTTGMDDFIRSGC